MPLDTEKYQRLKFDWPAERVLRITISRPERLNALDEIGHRVISYIWPEIDPQLVSRLPCFWKLLCFDNPANTDINFQKIIKTNLVAHEITLLTWRATMKCLKFQCKRDLQLCSCRGFSTVTVVITDVVLPVTAATAPF